MSQSKIEKFASISEAAVAQLSDGFFPGAFVVDVLPFLRYIPAWLPGAGFQRFAGECRVLTKEMQEGPLRYVKEQLTAGLEVSGLVATLLERKSDANEPLREEMDIKGVAATIFADFSDRPNLPYVEAIYREIMRWHPVAPLGVSHAVLEDDVYNGYLIPKGLSNLPIYLGVLSMDFRDNRYIKHMVRNAKMKAMTHDEVRYPQPDSFIPERFLEENGKLNDDDTVLAFGFGRRIINGRTTFSQVWLVIATTLATFNIRKAKDERGNEITIDGGYTDGLVSHKHPFHCSITPRSEEARKLIIDAQSRQD
ncbi:hypothetical protein C0995_008111 [Termitomyces sp. Mi166|nr:hypothetical protein C0995_008111 [Termitomyces sp. Mi166\